MDFAALATPPLPAPIAAALADGLQRLRPHAGQEAFDPEVPSALLAAGLQRLPLPIEAGGLGAGTLQTTAVLAALGAVDGSAALGLAMHCHSLGAARESGTWPAPLLARLYRSVVEEGALVNVAATEDAGGSPRAARCRTPRPAAMGRIGSWTGKNPGRPGCPPCAMRSSRPACSTPPAPRRIAGRRWWARCCSI